MASPEAKHDLIALLVANVFGYDRLMGEDRVATLQTLSDYRAVFSECVNQHNGRTVDAPEDAILAKFLSGIDAVNCAVEAQRNLAERNEKLPASRKMHFRIGVQFLDMQIKDREIPAEEFNAAIKLLVLAEPGGVCISRTVYDEVKPWLKLKYESRRDWTSFMSIPRHLFHPPPLCT